MCLLGALCVHPARARVAEPEAPLQIPREGWREKVPPPPDNWQAAAEPVIARESAVQAGENWWRLVYMQFAGNWEIYASDGNGANAVNLTNNGAQDVEPRLNSDGSQVVFASNRSGYYEIYTMSTAGGGARKLTSNGKLNTQPAWSPNGQHIVYTRWDNVDDTTGEIHRMNADGSGNICLTCSTGGDNYHAMWSPDGQKIAYARTSTGDLGRVWTMNADGSGKAQLTGDLWYLRALAWSPKGDEIAIDYGQGEDFFNGIGTANVNSGAITTRIAGQRIQQGVLQYSSYWIGSWTPNGQGIYYSLRFYVVSGGRLQLQSQNLMRLTFGSVDRAPETLGLPTATSNVVRPDAVNLDKESPVSKVQLASAYSPANAPFTVVINGKDDQSGAAIYYQNLSGSIGQFRIGETGAWTQLHYWPYATALPGDQVPQCSVINGYPGTFTGTLSVAVLCSAAIIGQRVYFRSVITDQAGNVEAFPVSPDYDAFTTIYAAGINGATYDARELPVSIDGATGAPNLLGVVTTTNASSFGAYFGTSGARSLDPFLSGYADLPSRQIQALPVSQPCPPTCPPNPAGSSTQSASFYLPGSTELLTNGQLESGTSGWALTGGNAVSHTTTSQLSGNGAAQMSVGPGLNEPPSEATPFSDAASPSMFTDITGTVHAVWAVPSSGNTVLKYAIKTAAGSWTCRPSVLTIPYAATSRRIGLVGDATGGFDVLYPAGDASNTLNHCRKSAAGSICDAQGTLVIPGADSASHVTLAMDVTGTLHAALNAAPGNIQYYASKPVAGAWSASEQIGSADQLAHIALVVDALARPHAAWSRGITTNWPDGRITTEYTVTHQLRNGPLAWSAPHFITSAGTGFDIVATSDGAVHIAYNRNSANTIASRTPAGVWSNEDLSQQRPIQTVDRVWFDDAYPSNASVNFVVAGTAAWLSSNPVPQSGSSSLSLRLSSVAHSDVSIFGSTDTLNLPLSGHLYFWVFIPADSPASGIRVQWSDFAPCRPGFVWGSNPISGDCYSISMGALPPKGGWTQVTVPITAGLNGASISGLRISVLGGAANFDHFGVVYTPTQSAQVDSPLALHADMSDTLHLVSHIGGQKLRYQYKPAGGAWQTQASQFGTVTSALPGCCVATSREGVVHVMDADGAPWNYYRFNYITTPPQPPPSIAQSVSIPATAHEPTLSFMYSSVQGAAATGSLNTVVSEGATRTVVDTRPVAFQNNGWQHAWVDMSPWKGKTITVALELQDSLQSASVRIDEISLSEWRTPVINSVNPPLLMVQHALARTAAPLAQSELVTITGNNFIATPSVKIGGVSVTDIVAASPTQIVVRVDPALLPVGRSDVTVTNPAGERAVLVRSIQVKNRETYIPVILSW